MTILLLWLFVFVLSVNVYFVNLSSIKKYEAVSVNAIKITNINELKSISNNFNGNYYLGNDITISGKWEPIGNDYSGNGFTGLFDGNGYQINFNNAYYEANTVDDIYCGLFGKATNATIKNVSVIGQFTAINSNVGFVYCGGIVGYCNKYTKIFNSFNKANIIAESKSVGGFVHAGGISGSGGTIINCYNTGNIKGDSSDASATVSGIGGNIVSNCYNIGDINAYAVQNAYAGGINGRYGTITNCYNTGKVTAKLNTYGLGAYAGGISGMDGIITNCFSIGNYAPNADGDNEYVGGIQGYGDSFTNSYHNYSGLGNVGGIYVPQLQNALVCTNNDIETIKYNYVDKITIVNSEQTIVEYEWNPSYPWDFENLWRINYNINNGLPYLPINEGYTVTYISNEGDGEVCTKYYGSKSESSYSVDVLSVSDIGFTIPTGKAFSHWIDEDGTIYETDKTYENLTKNLVLTAVWVEKCVVSFYITTNVGVIFNICSSENNILQSIYVSAGSSFVETNPTFTYQAGKGQNYKIIISVPYSCNINHTTINGQQNLVSNVLYLTVNENFVVQMDIIGFLGNISIMV